MSDSLRRREHNRRFSMQMIQRILATSGHPLAFLVDPHTRWWKERTHGKQMPSVQMGHAESFHAGGVERLFLEDADFNQLSNWRGERQGAIFLKSGVLIGGVPVELRTAMTWEAANLLPQGTVAKSVRSEGWTGE